MEWYAAPRTKGAGAAHLDSIVESLTIAGPFVVWLFVFLAIRILADSVIRLLGKEPSWGQVLFAVDVIISVWLLLIFVGLVFSHRVARDRDDDIRAIERHCSEAKRTRPVDSEPDDVSAEKRQHRPLQNARTDGGVRREGLSILLLAIMLFTVILRDIFGSRK